MATNGNLTLLAPMLLLDRVGSQRTTSRVIFVLRNNKFEVYIHYFSAGDAPPLCLKNKTTVQRYENNILREMHQYHPTFASVKPRLPHTNH